MYRNPNPHMSPRRAVAATTVDMRSTFEVELPDGSFRTIKARTLYEAAGQVFGRRPTEQDGNIYTVEDDTYGVLMCTVRN